jgi:signal transduction histidine kinase
MLLNRRLQLAKCGSIGIQAADIVQVYGDGAAPARFYGDSGGVGEPDWQFLQAQRSPMMELTTRLVDGEMLEIQILDNADGIPPAIHDRLFDPFFTTKAAGMGLSTSYQVVTSLHGGYLTCRSMVGWGAAFVIQIPL